MRWHLVAALGSIGLALGCAEPRSSSGRATPIPTVTSGYGSLPIVPGLPPGHKIPPSPPYSANTALLRDRVEESIRLYERDRWERFVDAMDPGEFVSDLRVHQQSIDGGEWTTQWLFQAGDDLFEHELSAGEGYGPGRFRIHRPGLGGPDAGSCAECHHRGGLNGAGDVSENTFFDGDGVRPESALERNPPHAIGLGLVQRLAEEMSQELTSARENAIENARITKQPQAVLLYSKGISFGTLTARGDGTIDNSKLEGIDPDVVVKPFGWKGNFGNLRRFVIGGFQGHFGIQTAGVLDLPGNGPAWDRDGDGMPDEFSEGMLTAMLTYLAELEIPVILPPRDPDLLRHHSHGAELFQTIGCASCHVPSLPISDPHLRVSKNVEINLLTDGEAPRPRLDVYGAGIDGVPVFLFSDLKRHAMGAALAEVKPTEEILDTYETPGHRATAVIGADVFLTRPLWGLADTAPYMHDGRALTIDDAILAHGGEALTARDAFHHLDRGAQADLRIFLLSLSRYPRIDYR